MSLILGIESSCDETAVAVVEDGQRVRTSAVASQIAKHAPHGGVVPELAAREHLSALRPVLNEALTGAGITLNEVDAVAVTQGPGLMPALLVGLNFAKGLALNSRKPLIGINHFLAHIYGAFLESDLTELSAAATYPLLALVVSGGHTSLLLVDATGRAVTLGSTIDEQRTAEGGDAGRFHFPRPLTGGAGKALAPEQRYQFSFSGVKTALLYHLRNHDGEIAGDWLRDTAASYQEAVVDVLVTKTLAAVREFGVKTLVAAGGVACNAVLRRRLEALTPSGVRLRLAAPRFCTDNAAMVAGLGWHFHRRGEYSSLNLDSFARLPRISRVPFIG